MRGAFYSDRFIVDWSSAKEALSDSDPHYFMEKLLMADYHRVYTHLLIPTLFGVYYESSRQEGLRNIWRAWQLDKDQLAVVERQDAITMSCAFCYTQLKCDSKKPYQAVLRLIAGTPENNSREWRYDFIYGFACRKCQTMPWHCLYAVGENDLFLTTKQCFNKYGFCTEILPIRHFFEQCSAIENTRERVLYAVMFSYVHRVQQVPMEALQLFNNGHCYNCNKPFSKKNKPRACEKCQFVVFCSKHCYDYAQGWYHYTCCEKISKGQLFLTDMAFYINDKYNVCSLELPA